MENKWIVLKDSSGTHSRGDIVVVESKYVEGVGARFSNPLTHAVATLTTYDDSNYGLECVPLQSVVEPLIGKTAKVIGHLSPLFPNAMILGETVYVNGVEAGSMVCNDSKGKTWYVNPLDLEVVQQKEPEAYDYHCDLLTRIYNESIGNGLRKVDGKIMPIIPGALMDELRLLIEEDK